LALCRSLLARDVTTRKFSTATTTRADLTLTRIAGERQALRLGAEAAYGQSRPVAGLEGEGLLPGMALTGIEIGWGATRSGRQDLTRAVAGRPLCLSLSRRVEAGTAIFGLPRREVIQELTLSPLWGRRRVTGGVGSRTSFIAGLGESYLLFALDVARF
jgi:hypothetical protein